MLAFPYTRFEGVGAASGRELFLLGWPVLCTLALETFSESLHRQPLRFLMLFGDVLLQVLVHHLIHPSLHQQTQGTFVLFGLFLYFFTVVLSVMVFSCCSVLLTEESSPNVVGFSASFFICLVLSSYTDNLAGS